MEVKEQELTMSGTRAEEHAGAPVEAPQNAGGVSPEKFAKAMMTPLTVVASTSLQGLSGLIKPDSPPGLCFSLFMCGLVSTSGMIVCLRLVMEGNEFNRSEGERLKDMVKAFVKYGIVIMVTTLFGNMLNIVLGVSNLVSSVASLAAALVLAWSYFGFILPERLLQFRIVQWIWHPLFLMFVLALLGNSGLILVKQKEAQAMGPSARI